MFSKYYPTMTLIIEVDPKHIADYDSRFDVLKPSQIPQLIAENNYFRTDAGFETKTDGVLVQYRLVSGVYIPIKEQKGSILDDPEAFDAAAKSLGLEEMLTRKN